MKGYTDKPDKGRLSPDSRASGLKIITLTAIALIAFAANTVLGRLALGSGSIDAAGFTVVRLFSGAVVLFLITMGGKSGDSIPARGGWFPAAMLFLYAITFSFAYLSLDTGTGALILFGAVQITMIAASLLAGHRLHASEWIGVTVAFAGFVYLVLPGVTAPSTAGFVLMSVAGMAWGIYTVKGRGSRFPLADTAWNFMRTVPFIAVLGIVGMEQLHFSKEGILLAVLSGGITSGVGYAVWYAALGALSATQAAVVQLLVPVLAALGGVVFVSETLTLRLLVSAVMILGGILMVVLGKRIKKR